MSFWEKVFSTQKYATTSRIKNSPPEPPPKPKIGIAFGGGGLKGAAHIGVLKVFAEYGIKPDMVAGTSIGSAVASLFASGYDWQMMMMIFEGFDLESLVKISPSRKGLIPANGYTQLIRTCTKGKRIEEMDIPLKIVAVDLIGWKKIVFDKGDTALAVRASSAVPGVFTPVKIDDMLLVDGYILDNCPGDIVRDMGADIVFAISLFAPSHSEPKNILDIVNRSLDIATANKQSIDADYILRPIPRYIDFLSAESVGECFAYGEAAAREHIDEIMAIINNWHKS